MGSLSILHVPTIFSKFSAPFSAILIHLSELKFPLLLLQITWATFRLPKYALTVELFRPFFVIAQVTKAQAFYMSIGRLLSMPIVLQKE